jgi:SAM-dependent methyltransferase
MAKIIKPPFKGKLLIDIGAGSNASRANQIARKRHIKGNPEKIVAVDLNKFTNFKKPPNLELVQKDALTYLKELNPSSVRFMNSDWCIMSKESLSGTGPHKNFALTPELAREIRRVLVPRGKLFINTLGKIKDQKGLIEILENNGFRVSIFSLRKIWNKMETMPAAYKRAIEIGESLTGSKRIAEERLKDIGLHIVATKKKAIPLPEKF